MKKLPNYLLLDERAGIAGLSGKVDFKDSSVMMAGTAKECCDAANSNEFGEQCVVSTPDGYIM